MEQDGENADLRREVVDLRAALRLRGALLDDVDHRTKNTLQVAVAVLELQRRRSGCAEAREALDVAARRLLAIASVHNQVDGAAHEDQVRLDNHLDRICAGFRSYDGVARIETDLARMSAPGAVALPLGLITSELVMNALKYAFPGGRPGVIRVGLGHYGRVGEAILSVRDDGVGRDPARPDGFGSQLIRTFAGQIGASVTTLSPPGEGLRTEVRFAWPNAPRPS